MLRICHQKFENSESFFSFAAVFCFLKMITKDRIIEISTELFITKGCKSITMDDISTANGISKRTLYELFEDKSALLEACLTSVTNKRREVSLKLKEESSNILEYILAYQNYESMESERRSRVFTDEMRKFYPEVYMRAIESVKNEQLEYTKSLIVEGIGEGLFDLDSASLDVATKILALLVGLNSYALCDAIKKDHSRKEIFMSSVVIFLKGLSTDKGRKVIEEYLKYRNID